MVSEPASVSYVKPSVRVSNLQLFCFNYALFERRLIIGLPWPLYLGCSREILENLCLQAKDFGIAVNVFWKELPDKFYDPKACPFSLFSWYVGSVMQCFEPGSGKSLGKDYFRIKAKQQWCGSVAFCYESGSADPCLWQTDPTPAPNPVPAIFVIDLQDGKKTFFCLLLFEGTVIHTFTSFFTDKYA